MIDIIHPSSTTTGTGTSTSTSTANTGTGTDTGTGNRLLLAEEQQMFEIEKPHHNDVLCGRGVTTNRHPGNESFRSLVGLNKELYVSSTKREKMGISRSIVQAVRSLDPPGRFLDKDPRTLLWHDIGHKKAVEKTSQALRDGAAMLRKQLDADLGDPEFLNEVFSNDAATGTGTGKNPNSLGCKNNKNSKSEKSEGSATIISKINGKENNKDSKGISPDKVKAVKAKTRVTKKGHRRVKSNSEVDLKKSNKQSRRNKINLQRDEPLTPDSSYRPPWNYNLCPSPHSPVGPPPPHTGTRSLPNSPVTWVSRWAPERQGPYPPHLNSPYHRPSPSPYRNFSRTGRYSRSHSFEYHNAPSDPGRPPRHHSWSPYGSGSGDGSGNHLMRYKHRYHYKHSHEQFHHHHHSTQQLHTPHSVINDPCSPSLACSSTYRSPPSSNASMHKDRQNYSPDDCYYSKPPPPEFWRSPRHYYQHPYESYDPPRHQEQPSPQDIQHGEYTPQGPSRWTPRSSASHHHQQNSYRYSDADQPDKNEGLSVPHLGEDGRRTTQERFSPQLHLNPRSTRKIVRRQLTDDHHQEDFRPPTPNSPRYHKAKEEPSYYHFERVEEEEKASGKDEKNSVAYQSNGHGSLIKSDGEETRSPVASRPEAVKSVFRSSPEHDQASSTIINHHAHDREKETEAAAVMMEDNDSEDGQPVDDIAISPLPYDREDPVTLLDLPDDLLTIDIGKL